MNTERGTASVEGLLLILLLLLICSMGVEIRLLFRSVSRLQTATRNEAVATASLDGTGLRLAVFEREVHYQASNALISSVTAVGLDTLRCRYWIFVGTETDSPGR